MIFQKFLCLVSDKSGEMIVRYMFRCNTAHRMYYNTLAAVVRLVLRVFIPVEGLELLASTGFLVELLDFDAGMRAGCSCAGLNAIVNVAVRV